MDASSPIQLCNNCGAFAASSPLFDLKLDDWRSGISTDAQVQTSQLYDHELFETIQQYDELIDFHASTVNSLIARRRFLLDWRYRIFHVRSAIRRVPSEIWREIFLWTCPIPMRYSPAYMDLAPTILSMVCIRWRNIALSTPEIWANFFYDFEQFFNPQVNPKQILWFTELHLKRSQASHLHIRFWFPRSDTDKLAVSSVIQSVCKALQPSVHRWKTLFTSYFSQAAGHLSFLKDGGHELDSVECVHSSAISCLTLLSWCTEVKSVCISNTESNYLQAPEVLADLEDFLIIPHASELFLSNPSQHESQTQRLLSRLTMPSLSTLTFESDINGSWCPVVSALIRLLNRSESAETPRQLGITLSSRAGAEYPMDQNIIQLLEATPNVEVLRLQMRPDKPFYSSGWSVAAAIIISEEELLRRLVLDPRAGMIDEEAETTSTDESDESDEEEAIRTRRPDNILPKLVEVQLVVHFSKLDLLLDLVESRLELGGTAMALKHVFFCIDTTGMEYPARIDPALMERLEFIWKAGVRINWRWIQ